MDQRGGACGGAVYACVFVCVRLHIAGSGTIQGEVLKLYNECRSITRAEGERLNHVHQSPPVEPEGNNQGNTSLALSSPDSRGHTQMHTFWLFSHTRFVFFPYIFTNQMKTV